MLRATIARIVDLSTHHRGPVIGAALLVAVFAAFYAATHFAIDTNIEHLLSTELPWRQHEIAYETAFPRRHELTLAVVQAPTPENAKRAAELLAGRLAERHDVVSDLFQPGGGEF